MKKLILILLFLLFITPYCYSAEQYWHVSLGSGTDNTSSGASVANPFNSIQYAHDTLVVGNTVNGVVVALPYTVVVKGNITLTTSLSFTRDGTDDTHRITYMADRGGQFFGTVSEVKLRHYITGGYPVIYVTGAQFTTIRGFSLQPLANTGTYRGGFGVYCNGQDNNLIIEECWLHDYGSTTYRAGGIWVDPPATAYTSSTAPILRNNIFSNINGTSTENASGITADQPSYLYVYNNTFYNITQAAANGLYDGIIDIWGSNAIPTTAVIKNNIFRKSSYQLIQCVWVNATSNITLISDNNCFYLDGTTNTGSYIKSNGTNKVDYQTLTNWQGSPSSPDASSTNGDPLFEGTSTSRENYKIRPSTECVDKGIAGLVTVDNWERSRLVGSCDMGSYQYNEVGVK